MSQNAVGSHENADSMLTFFIRRRCCGDFTASLRSAQCVLFLHTDFSVAIGCALTECLAVVSRANGASNGDATAMLQRSCRAVCVATAFYSAFWHFHGRRSVAVRTPGRCDRPLRCVCCKEESDMYCVLEGEIA